MAEYIDRDAFLAETRAWYCKNCDMRKNSKGKFVYEIGETPCLACHINDLLDEVENCPVADVVDVVRCKDCRHRDPEDHKCDCGQLERAGCIFPVADDYFCAYGVKRNG